MWNLKRNDTKELITNQKQTHRLKELDIRLPEGKYGGRDREFGTAMHTLLSPDPVSCELEFPQKIHSQ